MYGTADKRVFNKEWNGMKKAIVTGANGFVGKALINKLIQKNIEVIAIDIIFDASSIWGKDSITTIVSSLAEIDILISNIGKENIDSFYHLAWRGVNGTEKSDPIIQLQNVQTAINAAKLAKLLNCKKFLCAGTIAERAVESLNHLDRVSGGMMYGAAKQSAHLILESYCKAIDLNFVWMQFSNIYGPDNLTGNLVSYTIGELSNHNKAYFGPANQPYDFIYLDDLLEAIFRLGNNTLSKNSYFIGSGTPRLLKDYLFEIGDILNSSDKIIIGARPDDGIVYTYEMFDNSSLVQDIGDYVSFSFSEGIRRTIESIR